MTINYQDHYDDPALYEYEYRRRRDDVNYYAALASSHLAAGSQVLDLCCGSGRVARAILRRDFHVVGVDRSEAMLARARASVARLPKRCRDHGEFICGDMRDLNLNRKFPLIISAFNSLEHLYSRADIERCLASVKRHLQPRGLFGFDVQMPDLSWLLRDPEKHWARTKFRHPATNQLLVYSTNHVYDPVAQVTSIRFYYEPLEAGPLKETAIVRLNQRKFFPAELRALLHYAGFEVISHDADFDGDDLDEFAESQVLLCRHLQDSTPGS